jgi:hypothetical protein
VTIFVAIKNIIWNEIHFSNMNWNFTLRKITQQVRLGFKKNNLTCRKDQSRPPKFLTNLSWLNPNCHGTLIAEFHFSVHVYILPLVNPLIIRKMVNLTIQIIL